MFRREIVEKLNEKGIRVVSPVYRRVIPGTLFYSFYNRNCSNTLCRYIIDAYCTFL
jgi:hypothetical protein